MLIISSSAKTLDLDKAVPSFFQCEQAPFTKTADKIAEELNELDLEELQKLYKVSDKITAENMLRFQNWSAADERPGLYMYKGDVFRELELDLYKKAEHDYASNSVFVMSGLYGIVGANHLIKPYRLEMKAELEGRGVMNDFWRSEVTDYLNGVVDRQGHKLLLNLASKEYSKAVDEEKLKVPMINVDFKEEQEGKLKIVGIFAKRARGMMINYCIKNKVETLEQLRHFKAAGYEFHGEKDGTLTFVR